MVAVNGNVILAGTLNVSSLPGFGAGSYTLLTYTGQRHGALTLGSCPSGYTITLDTSTAGEVRLVVE